MLKGISPVVGPDLLATLSRMGHGDEIVLADAHFPGDRIGRQVIRMDGIGIPDLLAGILPLFELDAYVPHPLIMMAPVPGDTLDPDVESRYRAVIDRNCPDAPEIAHIDRFAFYERATEAYAVIVTGEIAKYGNIILKKGVTPPWTPEP